VRTPQIIDPYPMILLQENNSLQPTGFQDIAVKALSREFRAFEKILQFAPRTTLKGFENNPLRLS
jgi:hypothetical protein